MTAPRSAVMRLMPSPIAPGQARDCVRQFVTGCELSHLLEDALLLTSELVTNAVTHGQGMVTLAIESDGASVGISVADGEEELPALHQPDSESLHGRGLCLVDEIAGSWGARPTAAGEGKAVWFRLP